MMCVLFVGSALSLKTVRFMHSLSLVACLFVISPDSDVSIELLLLKCTAITLLFLHSKSILCLFQRIEGILWLDMGSCKGVADLCPRFFFPIGVVAARKTAIFSPLAQ